MAQHDYNIGDQNGFDFLVDLNNALSAIATNNAGPSEPNPTFANMLWFDTNNDLMKMRNEANSAWVNLDYSPTFTGVPTAPTAAAATNTTQIATTAYTRTAIPNVLNATGSAPMFACRAWVNFNGTGTVGIRASGNVSSITDNGTGDYTVNFTTDMEDANYAAIGNGIGDTEAISRTPAISSKGTTSCTVRTTVIVSGVATDVQICDVAIFR